MRYADHTYFGDEENAHEMVRRGDITYGAKSLVVNPFVRLISKDHTLGPMGLA